MRNSIKELSEFPVVLDVQVQWGEMDAGQHVNNAIYLKWFETARIMYVTRLGYSVTIDETNMGQPGFILARQDCKYIFPVTFPDTISLGIKTVSIDADRFQMLCKMYSRWHSRVVAIAQGTMVTYNYYNRKKTKVPVDLRQSIENLEGSVF